MLAALGPVVAGTAPLIDLFPLALAEQAEGLLAQGGVLALAEQAALVAVAQGGGVGHSGNGDRGLEQQVGHHVAAGGHGQGSLKVGVLHVVGDAQVLGQRGNGGLPSGTGELAVLVIAHHAQDHGQRLVPDDGVIGVEGGGAGALDVLGVGAVAHVSHEPLVAVHVDEVAAVGADLHLLAVHIAGGDAVDDGSHLRAGDGVTGAEAAFVALEDLQSGPPCGFFLPWRGVSGCFGGNEGRYSPIACFCVEMGARFTVERSPIPWGAAASGGHDRGRASQVTPAQIAAPHSAGHFKSFRSVLMKGAPPNTARRP